MSERSYHLVHANVARMRAPLDNPRMAGFMARIEEIHALAQDPPGFVAQPALACDGGGDLTKLLDKESGVVYDMLIADQVTRVPPAQPGLVRASHEP